jgi:hypothetical protein
VRSQVGSDGLGLGHGLNSRKQRCRGVAQPGSAPALGAGGRAFKSPRPDQWNQPYDKDQVAIAIPKTNFRV